MLFGVADKGTKGTGWRREKEEGIKAEGSRCSYLSTVRRNDYSRSAVCVCVYI